MRYIFIITFILCVYTAIGQNAPAPSAPAPVAPVLAPPAAPVITPVAPVLTPKMPAGTDLAPAKPAPASPIIAPVVPAAASVVPTPATAQVVPSPAAASTTTAAAASGGTNAPPPAPPKDPAKCVIAHFSFDNTLQPDVGGGTTIPVVFKRESAAYQEGAPVGENSPRFVEGRFNKALLLESAYANLFSIAQAGASDAAAFVPVQGSALSISSDPGSAEASQPWQGKEALAVATKGENSEEGFSAETPVEKALYTKETSPSVVSASYLASLYLKGQGNVKLMLKDAESGECGEPVYVELSANWQRFSCVFAYSFNSTNIGANHDADWKNLIQGTNINARLQLVCTTVDSQKLNFFADGLQLEKRLNPFGKNAELSPHSWVLGAFQTDQEQLGIDIKNDYFNAWKKNGSMTFWFKPLWEARDSSKEMILQITKNQLYLSHDSQKIIFAPAGVSFAPSDWKNSWHHMVITWSEAGERALYVDGMDYPNAAGETRPLKTPGEILMGDFTKNLSPNGAFDELTLYNITLNPDQVKALVAAEPAAKPAEANSAEQSPATASPAPASKPAPAAKNDDDEEEEDE